MRFRGPLLLGALLAVPTSLQPTSDVLYAVVIAGFFALVFVGLIAQIRAGVLGLRRGSPTPAVAGTTVAYWGAATIVMVWFPGSFAPSSDIVTLLIAAGVTGVVVIAVTSAAKALESRLAARRGL